MIHLGMLEMQQGNLPAARRSLERAISTGIMPEAQKAEELLADMKHWKDQQQRADHFGRYGWRAYADEELMTSNPSVGYEEQEKDEGS
jgi:hypothetical protein